LFVIVFLKKKKDLKRKKERKKMNFWGFVFGDEDAASTTPTSESSVEDLAREDAVKIVKSTWKELMRKKEEVGLSIYQEVLLKEVEMSRLFLRTKIDAQSNSFMMMLDTVVGYLDDLSTLDEKLIALGATHLNHYRVKKRHFKHFRTAFMRAIKQYIPWTDRREAAWMWFWGRVIDRMTADNSLIPFAKDTTPQQYMEYARVIHETFDAVITDDPQSFITVFYQELLESQPDIANLFKHSEIKQQGAKFISMVRHCIHLLDDHRTFEYKMVELGKTHFTYGVELTQLQSFGDVFTDNLRRGTPLKWTDEHTKAWEWFWKIVVDLFSRGMLEYQEEKKRNGRVKKRT